MFYNGNPILVDAGVGVYSGATFGPGRYKIWTMQSAYHNLPTINGEMQRHGDDSAAKNVKYSYDSKIVHFDMDIAGAYPKEAWVKQWNRNITFNRAAQTVLIDENYELTKFVKPAELNFLVYAKPVIDSVKGVILFEIESKPTVMMNYDPRQFTPSIEVVKMDSKITAAWGEKLYRLKLTLNNSKLKNKIQISFKRGKI